MIQKFASGIDLLFVVGIAIGTAKFFEWCDVALSDSARMAIAKWLSRVPDDGSPDTWMTVFSKLIDRVFGSNALSRKFIFRSCVASLLAFSICAFRLTLGIRQYWGGDTLSLVVKYLFWIACSASLVPDYFSLLVSRQIVKLMAEKPKASRIALLLFIDTSVTAVIAYCGSFIGLIVYWIGRHYVWYFPRWKVAWEIGIHTVYFPFVGYNIHRVPFAISFASAFFTSMWVWLYIASGVLTRALHSMRLVWKGIMPYLDIEKKPLVAMGRVAGVLASLAYLIAICTVWAVHHL